MSKERGPGWESQSQEFWNIDTVVGRINLYGAGYPLGLRGHAGPESYRERRDLVPLQHPTGTCDYVLVHPYILLPALRPLPSRGAVGSLSSGNGHGRAPMLETGRRERIGDGQAWYYRQDRTLVLWECMLFPRHRQPSPHQDPNLMVLWQGFERFLRQRFPAARQIVTPKDEPEYEPDEWEKFLSRRGFQDLGNGAFGKELDRDD